MTTNDDCVIKVWWWDDGNDDYDVDSGGSGSEVDGGSGEYDGDDVALLKLDYVELQ